MKKNGKPKGPGNNGAGAAAESLRNRKTYLNRLEEMGLDEPPAIKRAKMPSAIELARLAAALEKDSTSEVSAGDLAARAREIWKASADAPFVEEMAEFVVRGLCLFDKNDWTRHCRALIGLLDDSEGAVPGLRTSEHDVRSIRRARVRASMAAAQVLEAGRAGRAGGGGHPGAVSGEVGDGGEPEERNWWGCWSLRGTRWRHSARGVGYEVRHSRSRYSHRSLDAVDSSARRREVR